LSTVNYHCHAVSTGTYGDARERVLAGAPRGLRVVGLPGFFGELGDYLPNGPALNCFPDHARHALSPKFGAGG
jgi:hypothetical protein